MGLFNFVGDWKRRLIDDPLDAKMAETLKIGLAVARGEVHVISGYLQSTIGGEYDRSTKTIKLHADAKYALLEETRPPLGRHSFLAPAANEMARLWGGNFELHYPNAYEPKGVDAMTRRIRGITRFHKSLGSKLGRRTRVIVRRHHRLSTVVPLDPTTPIL